jgi:serine/threonine-protein kinase
VDLAGDRGQEPEAALARVATALPGDPVVRTLRADLAERRGRPEEALADRRAAAAQVPSWRNLRQLADLESRTGRIADAREHLQRLLERSPGNVWGRFTLARIELAYGDPARAERLYHDLIESLPPQRGMWTNLGLARFLAGRYEAAIDAYRQALALSPLHATVLLDLADAELALGRREEAQAHYRQSLARLEQIETSTGLGSEESLFKAQCLAHLNRTGEAAELAQRVLQQRPGEPDIVYGAALVYALVGDRTSARVNAKAALRQGYGPRWFGIAAFDFLRDDPELRSQLAAGAPR